MWACVFPCIYFVGQKFGTIPLQFKTSPKAISEQITKKEFKNSDPHC